MSMDLSGGMATLVDPPIEMLARDPEVIRIAMWSGPRNISTAMMRAFENRDDTSVIDEPFYAAYLRETGLDHPMREDVLASQPNDWQDVVDAILGPVPNERPIWYQKHMTHHMLPDFGRGWIDQVISAFLIRRPESVLASYGRKREEVTLRDIGFVEQVEIFERVADRLGDAPPVIDGADVLANPRRSLARLCEAVGIPFREAMLAWPPGPRATDGVWAPYWYHAVEASTGFAKPKAEAAFEDLPDTFKVIADLARPYYERMRGFKLG
jgi:Sulfotransferase domain